MLFLACVVAVKVFKKTTPNSKVTLYLGTRSYVDHLSHTDPVGGVVVVDNDYLQGRKVYGELVMRYVFGREEDEVMGLKFSKEMILVNEQVVPAPSNNRTTELSVVQKQLLKRYGASAAAFTFHFPEESPCSVTIQSLADENSKPLGVEYHVRVYVAHTAEEATHRRSSASLGIKKIQYAPLTIGLRLPNALVSKGFPFSPGNISLEVSLDKDVYYHGEKISVNVTINNSSRKRVKKIKLYVVQHCDVTMVIAQFSRYVAKLKSREGCPVVPGYSLSKVFSLTPDTMYNKDLNGVALNGSFKDEGVTLASSTLVGEGKVPSDALGIVVSYSVRVKLHCGHIGGDIVAQVPFKLLNPSPESDKGQKLLATRKNLSLAQDYGILNDNIVFEDFTRSRLIEV